MSELPLATSLNRPRAPELLAPAGDDDALRAAVANGADAVYFGLSDFNARHRAANFTLEQLPATMQFLHEHNVRGYVAFNTLVFSDELPRAVEYLSAIMAAGADAVIVQDLGIVRLIKSMARDFPVHGSTQMSLADSRGIEFVRRLGVERVILARELSTREIGRIAAKTPMPLEVFVHGALCVAYSGQCLTSEALGGRSANRGQCAQACRQPYELLVDGRRVDLGERAYLLSPQDLAAYDLVGELTRLGVHSLKIEGRLKSAHYVAATTQTYRAAIDAAADGRVFALSPQEERDLTQSFSRGFTHGFLDGINHQQLVQGRFPKNRGVRIGTVVGVSAQGVDVEVDPKLCDATDSANELPVKPGDGVVFDEGHPEQDEQGGRVFAVDRLSDCGNRLLLRISFGRGDVNLAAVSRGSTLWKTDDPALWRRLERSYAHEAALPRIPLSLEIRGEVGGLLQITGRDDKGNEAAVVWVQRLSQARKHPLTAELVSEQFGRLGKTPFRLADVTFFNSAGKAASLPVMVPKSVLNDLRRRLAEQLLECRRTGRGAARINVSALDELRSALPAFSTPAGTPRLTVLCRKLEQLRAVLDWTPPEGLERPELVYCDFEEVRLSKQAVELAQAAGTPIALATPRIVKPGEDGLLLQIANCRPDAVLVRNLAALSFFGERLPRIPLIGDYSLNVANELTAGLLVESGLETIVPSYDLNLEQLLAMLRRIDPALFEVVLHQHVPMFHMEHCVFSHALSNGKDFHDCGRPCDLHRVELRDHVGEAHPLAADVGCRNTLFNARAQSAAPYVPRLAAAGIRQFRVELLQEAGGEVGALLDTYARVLGGRDAGPQVWRELKVLNQVGITRGTLEFE